MDEEISAAEGDGLSLETRCEQALIALRRHWETLQTVSTKELYSERGACKRDALILDGLEGPLREELAGMLADVDKVVADARAHVFSALWNVHLQFLRDIYGSDAVDFALKATERERMGN